MTSEELVIAVIGSFLILRFFNPLLLTPESSGLLDGAPDPKVKRTLILVSKILQNVANRHEFSEDFMLPLNPLVREESPNIRNFFFKLCEPPTGDQLSQSSRVSRAFVDKDFSKTIQPDLLQPFYALLHKHLYKIGVLMEKEPQMHKPFESLLQLMAEIGPPPQPKNSGSIRSKEKKLQESIGKAFGRLLLNKPSKD